MGKGGGGGHQIIQPPDPVIPGESTLQGFAGSRAAAAAPWVNSPYRAIDYFSSLMVPQLQMPTFNPGMSMGAWGPNPGGQAPQFAQTGNGGLGVPLAMGLPPGQVYSSLVSGHSPAFDFSSSPWGGATSG